MKKRIMLAVSSLLCLFMFSAPALVLAQSSKDAVCEGVGLTSSSGTCTQPADQLDLNTAITKGLSILSILIAIASVIMIMIGGLKYITSNGEAARAASAKDTILYAVIGLVVAALAQVIVRFVLVKLK